MALYIKKSQSAVLLVAEKMCLQFSSELLVELFVAEVERQPVPQTWSGGGKVPVSITAFCACNCSYCTRPDVGRPQRVTTTSR